MVKRGIVWLLLSSLVTVALVLSACQPAPEETAGQTVKGQVVEKDQPKKEEAEEPTAEEPKAATANEPTYGGWVNVAYTRDITFNPAGLNTYWLSNLMYESLIDTNWATGPSGTGEFTTLLHDWWKRPESMIGRLAESWEQTDLTTFVLHMRQGIRFHDIPPVNGRELVADDVVFSFEWHQAQPRSWTYKPPNTPEDKTFRATALDKYTVEVLMPEPDAMVLNDWPTLMRILPREYGDLDPEEWTSQVGTGPFIITDYVPSSSTIAERNPEYWMADPSRPGNQLPYIDGITQNIVPDQATQQAALRTGKIDHLIQVPRLEGKNLHKTNPELQYSNPIRDTSRLQIFMNTQEAPLSDKRVRQALSMALNWDALVDGYFDGEAIKLTWPYYPYHEGYYTPLEELPENLQQLYEYRPDEAKQLLADAGYPNGFKTYVLNSQTTVEALSLVQEYWADIGVDLELRVTEPAALGGLFYTKNYTGMYASAASFGNAAPEMMYRQFYKPGHVYNASLVDDAHINSEYAKVSQTMDLDEQKRIMKDLGVYTIEQVYTILFPNAYSWIFWQPWIKGYSGELYSGVYWHVWGFLQYAWIDQDLKAELGH
jgi:peptide/nickel transport system substrate-binding protein